LQRACEGRWLVLLSRRWHTTGHCRIPHRRPALPRRARIRREAWLGVSATETESFCILIFNFNFRKCDNPAPLDQVFLLSTCDPARMLQTNNIAQLICNSRWRNVISTECGLENADGIGDERQ